MALTCPECGVAGVNCVCVIIENAKQSVKELKMNLRNNMTPVEIDNPIDRKWRQLRDEANKGIAIRTALVEFNDTIHARAEEIEVEMAEMMTLGGLHPNTRSCMGDD